MAFNWQTFKTRTLTAAVFVVVMLVGLLWNQWSFFILFSVIHFGCWWEYLKLIEKIFNRSFNNILKFGWMIIGYGIVILFADKIFQIFPHQPDNVSLLMIFVVIYALLFIVLGMLNKARLWNADTAASFGLIYISLSCGLIIDLNDFFISCRTSAHCVIEIRQFFPLIIIFSLWINDTMAYIVGSWIGKTQMTIISPKKTWEGTLGGVILCTVVIGVLFSLYSKKYLIQIDSHHWYIISLITAIVGTIGDLFESKLKRMAGVKDSGHIMPGHGGFLDRFDSLLFATPFVWLYVYFFM